MTSSTHATVRLRRLPLRAITAGLIAATLAACGGTEQAAAPGQALSTPGGAQQVETRVGDTTVFAVAMQTSTITPEVAREHGIERRDDLVMLRVSGRQGSGVDIASVPLQVRATSTDLRGQTQTLDMQQAVANDLVDYVGTVQTALPDTLRFDIRVTTPEGANETLQLTREIQAR
jgi:hypothetical protein